MFFVFVVSVASDIATAEVWYKAVNSVERFSELIAELTVYV